MVERMFLEDGIVIGELRTRNWDEDDAILEVGVKEWKRKHGIDSEEWKK